MIRFNLKLVLSAVVLAAAASLALAACKTTAGASSSDAVVPHPADVLADLDKRKPVPLQPMMANHQKQNMRGHLEAVQRITLALANEDWETVKAAGGELGTSPKMKKMCTMLGAGAPGFTPMGLSFHESADAIGVAADNHDAKGVLSAMSATLQICTSCHATYRQNVVSRADWEKQTGMKHNPAMMHKK